MPFGVSSTSFFASLLFFFCRLRLDLPGLFDIGATSRPAAALQPFGFRFLLRRGGGLYLLRSACQPLSSTFFAPAFFFCTLFSSSFEEVFFFLRGRNREPKPVRCLWIAAPFASKLPSRREGGIYSEPFFCQADVSLFSKSATFAGI